MHGRTHISTHASERTSALSSPRGAVAGAAALLTAAALCFSLVTGHWSFVIGFGISAVFPFVASSLRRFPLVFKRFPHAGPVTRGVSHLRRERRV